jgi:Putative zinc-finger
MTTNDELVRLRKAFAVSLGPAPEPEACPPSDRIWLAVRGELPPDELREILDHVATCHACAEDWRIAMAFEEESRAGLVAAPPSTRSRSVVARFRPWLAAAAVILVSVVGFQLQGPKPNFRFGEVQTVEVESLLKDASIPRQHFVLSWKDVPEAASYNLTVSTFSKDSMETLVQEEGVTATSYKVPESVLANLKPGAKVLWNVTPVSQDGGLLHGRTFQAFVQ